MNGNIEREMHESGVRWEICLCLPNLLSCNKAGDSNLFIYYQKLIDGYKIVFEQT